MIRKMTPQDREQFHRMARQFYYSDAVLHIIPDEFHSRAFEEILRSDAYLEGYFLEYEGVPAGYGLIAKTYSHEIGGMVYWIDELYVLEEYRSKGLGKEFFSFLHENAPAAAFRLEVEPANAEAIRLYEKLGFKRLKYTQMVKEKPNKERTKL